MHKFIVTPNTSAIGIEVFVPEGAVMGIVAILSRADAHRVKAIKALREMSRFAHGHNGSNVMGLGLYEAKQIVDFLADNASFDTSGNVVIERKRPTVDYIGSGF